MLPYSDYSKSRALFEVYKLIKKGEYNTAETLSDLFGVHTDTIKNYIDALRDEFEVDIVYDKTEKIYRINYEENICADGVLERIKYTQPITADDVLLLISALVKSQTFMETKMEIIKKGLLSLLSNEEAEKLKGMLHFEKTEKKADQHIELNVTALRKAMIDEKKVKFSYKAANGNCREHIITPYSFAWELGKYYIICIKEGKAQLSHYRVDRMSNMKILDEPSIKDTTFNVYDYLKKTWNMFSGKDVTVKVKFHNDCYKAVTERDLVAGQLLERNDSHFTYEFNCHGTAGIKLWLMGFGWRAEVLEPLSLRDEIKDEIVKMGQTYS